ncbi:MAG TPA: carbohydrate-binding family 9-like protein [Flavitalea sp.]|nr:carbohydrate-binding family 9-like protein [Flavitalea sp.]
MMNNFIYILFVFVAMLSSSGIHAQHNDYRVKYLTNSKIKVDGRLKESDWKKCKRITNFVSPWKNVPLESTVFRAAYDERNFYFAFEVTDNKIITSPKKEEIAATEADRVELFFSHDTSMIPYYCFEMAPNELVYDYKAQFHRQFFAEWRAAGVTVKACISKNKYVIEGVMPLSLIAQINGTTSSLRGTSVLAGVFRADKDIVSSSEDDFTWISWIRPNADQPDFHIPSALGTFKFE